MMISCPMTSKIKGDPFEVIVSREAPSAGLSDQVKSLDWRARQASFKGKVPSAALAEAPARLQALLGLPCAGCHPSRRASNPLIRWRKPIRIPRVTTASPECISQKLGAGMTSSKPPRRPLIMPARKTCR